MIVGASEYCINDRYCGTTVPPEYYSLEGEMTIKYNVKNDGQQLRGFRAQYVIGILYFVYIIIPISEKN